MRVHDLYHNHPKVKKISMAARGLWVTCLSWQAAYLTDGIIPHRTVKELGGTDPQIRSLLKVGLWHETQTEEGELAYEFHDWLDHNQSRETVLRERNRKRKEAANRRAQSKQEGNQGGNQEGNQGVKCTPISQDESASDLHKPDPVSGLDIEIEVEEDTRQERDSARPPGGSLPEAETETRDEDGRQEDTGCQVIPLPDLSAGTLRDRFSALNEKSGTTKRSESAPVSKPLEKMSPKELLDYMETFHWEVNNIHQDGGQAGISTMRAFQRRYGNERAAAIIRELFVNGGGRYKVGREVEVISYRHFSKGLGWFTDKVDLDLQSKAQREVEVERDFTFASEL